MNSKVKKIILLVLLFIGLVVLGIFLTRNRVENRVSVTTDIENPFGIPGSDVDLGNGNGDLGREEGSNNENGDSTELDITFFESRPALRQVFENQVSGFTFTFEEREIINPDLLEAEGNLVEQYDFSGFPTLRFGDEKEEVSKLKIVLNRQVPSPNLEINNAFDTDLKNAVIGFQNNNNLTPDGIVGRGTYSKLNEFQGIEFNPVAEKENVEIVKMARFVERGGGRILERALEKEEEVKEVVSTNIPIVYEAYFGNDGEKVVLRYLNQDDEIQTYLGEIIDRNFPSLGVQKVFEGGFLQEDIEHVSVSYDKDTLFYYVVDAYKSLGFEYNLVNDRQEQIMTNSFSEWLPQSLDLGSVSLTTKASALYPGYSYIYNKSSQKMERVLGDLLGLTTNISPDGNKVLYSYIENGSLRASVYDLDTNVNQDFSPVTLAEKCVWSSDSIKIYCGAPENAPGGSLPDDWYKGKVSFEDSIWETNLDLSSSEMIYNIKGQRGVSLDLYRPEISPNNDFLLFMNKNDNSLWSFDLGR